MSIGPELGLRRPRRPRAPSRVERTSSSNAPPSISPATSRAPSRFTSVTATRAPSAASRRQVARADSRGAAGHERCSIRESHRAAGQTTRNGFGGAPVRRHRRGEARARARRRRATSLTVVANTGDDVDVYGVHVSPDPDLVTYWLADEIDERGWGLRDDTWQVMDALARAGRPHWFRLGDRDLAMCLIRTELLRAGELADRGARRGGRGARREGARAADVGPAGGHVGHDRRPRGCRSRSS